MPRRARPGSWRSGRWRARVRRVADGCAWPRRPRPTSPADCRCRRSAAQGAATAETTTTRRRHRRCGRPVVRAARPGRRRRSVVVPHGDARGADPPGLGPGPMRCRSVGRVVRLPPPRRPQVLARPDAPVAVVADALDAIGRPRRATAQDAAGSLALAKRRALEEVQGRRCRSTTVVVQSTSPVAWRGARKAREAREGSKSGLYSLYSLYSHTAYETERGRPPVPSSRVTTSPRSSRNCSDIASWMAVA